VEPRWLLRLFAPDKILSVLYRTRDCNGLYLLGCEGG
jgi:hypothetical protein